MRRAVVDIGATACQLVVAETAGGGWPEVCHDRVVPLGLGRAVGRDGRVGEGLLQLAAETLRRLHAAAARSGAEDLEATLSERLLGAADGALLRERAEDALQVAVQVIGADEELRTVTRAVRHRLGLVADPRVIELADDRLRLAAPNPGGTLRVVEVPSGLRDLAPVGGVELLHPSVFDRTRDRIRTLVGAFADGVPAGTTTTDRPVVVGAPAVALGSAVSRRGRGHGTAEGQHLSLATLTDLEQDLLTVYGAQEFVGGVPASLEAVALTAMALRAILQQLRAPGVVISNVSAAEARLWDRWGRAPRPERPGPRPPVRRGAPDGRPRAVP